LVTFHGFDQLFLAFALPFVDLANDDWGPFTCAEARASVFGSRADQARHEHQPKTCAKNGRYGLRA
jgi:hypothetical protein